MVFSIPVSHTATYTHVQSVPATRWTIVHNLGKLAPAITLLDTDNCQVFTDITYVDLQTAQLDFTSPFAGQAILM